MEKTDSEIYREYLDRLHLYFDPLIKKKKINK